MHHTNSRVLAPEEIYALSEKVFQAGIRAGLDYDSCKDLLQWVVIKCCVTQKALFNSARGSLEGFLYHMAKNTAVDMQRRTWRWSPIDPADLLVICEQQNADCIEQQELHDEQLARLHDALKGLHLAFASKKQYEAFMEVALLGHREKDVAEKLHLAESTIAGAKRRGIQHLRKLMHKDELLAS